MQISERPSLRGLNSFGLEARAQRAVTIETEDDLTSLPPFNPRADLLLGGGSNVLLTTDVPGTVFLNRIRGRAIVAEHDGQAWVEVGAGENWHRLVRWSLDEGLCGLENLSLIPGLAGAAPIQNIGAYGVELSGIVDRLTAWDWHTANRVRFARADCGFAYRESRFKSAEPDRYLIISLRLRLSREFNARLDYAGLSEELAAAGVLNATPRDVSDAVIRLRRRKLPDPAKCGNAGSFFKNPVVSKETATGLLNEYPELPVWADDAEQVKLSAAWMIERCGCKGQRRGDAGVSQRHALVLINHGAATGRDVLALAESIKARVADRFGITLETEPRILAFPEQA
ncbi:MAG: UDP-N-acetylmuramate dehydrogenase [Xanthomonadales bacterium]|nr:UDP-N-acetylmuramate dehydrogenase [Xanthomonadales bacterium]